MSKFICIVIFIIIELVLLPVTIIGMMLFIIDFAVSVIGKKMSLTTYDPMFARWSWELLGKREDPATHKLAFALPGMSRVPVTLAFGPTLLAMCLSDYYFGMYDYPLEQSDTLFNGVLGQRTTFFDKVMQQQLDQVEQVVILGGGWDTRAYGMAQREGVRVFEVDAVGTQTYKLEAIKKAKIDTGNTVFAAVDFNTESWLDALKRVDFDSSKKTYVHWEFVAVYLEPEAVAATLQTVANDLAPGSAIAFEVMGQHIIDGDTSLFLRFALWEAKQLGEGWYFGVNVEPPAEENVAAYLQEHGLTLTNFEPLGGTDKKGRRDGAYVLAVNG